MKRFSIVITIFISIFMLSSNTSARTEKDLFLDDLNHVYEMGKDIYCYWDNKKEMYGIDWDALYSKAKAEMESADNIKDYYRIMREMIAGVKDGHVNFWLTVPGNYSAFYMPIAFRDIDGKIIVKRLDKSAFLNGATVNPGDEVLEINGESIEKRISFLSKYYSGSTPKMVRNRAVRALNSLEPFEAAPRGNLLLKVKRFDTGKVETVEVPWQVYNPETDPTYKDDQQYKLTDDIEARILPGNIGYLRISSMSAPIDEGEFLDYIEEQFLYLIDTYGLIIDVRGNGGGYGEVGKIVVSHLINNTVTHMLSSPKLSMSVLALEPYYQRYEPDPETNGLFGKWQEITVDPAPKDQKYNGVVLALFDSWCFSACDTFVSSLASNGLAVTMGENTGGGTGAPIIFDLPSYESQARFSVRRGKTSRGEYIEGKGTSPEIKASLTVKDIVEGTDSVLIKAYNEVLDRIPHTMLKAEKAIGYILGAKDASSEIIPLRNETILPAFVLEQREIDSTNMERE